MGLWNKTILAVAITLLIAGCEDSDKKIETNIQQTKSSAAQIKDTAAENDSAIEDEADKKIDVVKYDKHHSKLISLLKRLSQSK